jgi:hypothetical protein
MDSSSTALLSRTFSFEIRSISEFLDGSAKAHPPCDVVQRSRGFKDFILRPNQDNRLKRFAEIGSQYIAHCPDFQTIKRHVFSLAS